jgi:hypothetical protein
VDIGGVVAPDRGLAQLCLGPIDYFTACLQLPELPVSSEKHPRGQQRIGCGVG